VERGEVPRDWYKWAQAAYLLSLTWSVKAAASAVGVGERTLWRWKADPRWDVFRQSAGELWALDVVEAARLAVLRALARDDATSVRLAERILADKLPGLAPQATGNGSPTAPGVSVGVVVGLPPQDTGSRGEAIEDRARVLELGEIPDDQRKPPGGGDPAGNRPPGSS
jgi:hypothetical protein